MIMEKRCKNENDFVQMYCTNKTKKSELNSDQKSYQSIQNFIEKRDAAEKWRRLLKDEQEFFDRYGYLDIAYSESDENYQRKKVRGRPKKSEIKSNRITIRISEHELKIIDNYCKINNLKDRSEAIREAISRL